jgi:hypothetical protein
MILSFGARLGEWMSFLRPASCKEMQLQRSLIMSAQAPLPELHRLLAEALEHDDNAVKQVEQLIDHLRDQQRAAQEWQSVAPEWCDYGRIPHC